MAQATVHESNLIQAAHSLLVVIDVQQKLAPHIDGIEDVVTQIVKLIRLARIMEIPVLVTEQEKLGETVEAIRLAGNDTPPISKSTFSCFGSDEFQHQLKRHQKSTLILTGIETHICVSQTALVATPAFRVQVVGDATASRNSSDHQIALKRMHQTGLTVTSTEMVMYEWLERAGTDMFRQALPLLKE